MSDDLISLQACQGLRQVLQHCWGMRVWGFGSRVRWRHRYILSILSTCPAWSQRSLFNINMLSQITGTFKASVPQIFLISPPYRNIYNYLLILLFLLALSAFFAASLVAFF